MSVGKLSIVKIQDILEKSRKDGFSKFEWQHRDKNNEIVWGEISLTQIVLMAEKLRISVEGFDFSDLPNVRCILV